MKRDTKQQFKTPVREELDGAKQTFKRLVL